MEPLIKASPDVRTPLYNGHFAESQMHSLSANQPLRLRPPSIKHKLSFPNGHCICGLHIQCHRLKEYIFRFLHGHNRITKHFWHSVLKRYRQTIIEISHKTSLSLGKSNSFSVLLSNFILIGAELWFTRY